MKKIEINTVHTIRTASRDPHTGMHLSVWLREEVNIRVEEWEDPNEAKLRAIGTDRRAIDREMARLMNLVK